MRTGMSFMDFFQAVFTRLVIEYVSYEAEGSFNVCLIKFTLRSAFKRMSRSLALCTPIIRIRCPSLEPAAFLMHPIFAVIAVDTVVTNESTWELICALQKFQAHTADHDVCLFCIYR